MDWLPRSPSAYSGSSQPLSAESVASVADGSGCSGAGDTRGGRRGNPFDDEDRADSSGAAVGSFTRTFFASGTIQSASSFEGSWLPTGSLLAERNPFEVAEGGTCACPPTSHDGHGWPVVGLDSTRRVPVDGNGVDAENDGFNAETDDVESDLDDDVLWTVVLSSLPQFSASAPPRTPVVASASLPSFIDTPGLSSSYLADPRVDGPASRHPPRRRGADTDAPFSLSRAEEDATAWVASARSALASAAAHTADVERSLGVIADAAGGIADRARALAVGLSAAAAAAAAARARTAHAAAVADRLAVVARAVSLPAALAADVWGAPVGGAAFVTALATLEGKVAALAGSPTLPPLGIGAGGAVSGVGADANDPGLVAETAAAASVAEVAPKVRLLVHHAASRAEAVATARVADLASTPSSGRPAAVAALATVAPHVAFLARVSSPAAARVSSAYATAASRYHLDVLPRYATALASQWRRAERARDAATCGERGGKGEVPPLVMTPPPSGTGVVAFPRRWGGLVGWTTDLRDEGRGGGILASLGRTGRGGSPSAASTDPFGLDESRSTRAAAAAITPAVAVATLGDPNGISPDLLLDDLVRSVGKALLDVVATESPFCHAVFGSSSPMGAVRPQGCGGSLGRGSGGRGSRGPGDSPINSFLPRLVASVTPRLLCCLRASIDGATDVLGVTLAWEATARQRATAALATCSSTPAVACASTAALLDVYFRDVEGALQYRLSVLLDVHVRALAAIDGRTLFRGDGSVSPPASACARVGGLVGGLVRVAALAAEASVAAPLGGAGERGSWSGEGRQGPLYASPPSDVSAGRAADGAARAVARAHTLATAAVRIEGGGVRLLYAVAACYSAPKQRYVFLVNAAAAVAVAVALPVADAAAAASGVSLGTAAATPVTAAASAAASAAAAGAAPIAAALTVALPPVLGRLRPAPCPGAALAAVMDGHVVAYLDVLLSRERFRELAQLADAATWRPAVATAAGDRRVCEGDDLPTVDGAEALSPTSVMGTAAGPPPAPPRCTKGRVPPPPGLGGAFAPSPLPPDAVAYVTPRLTTLAADWRRRVDATAAEVRRAFPAPPVAAAVFAAAARRLVALRDAAATASAAASTTTAAMALNGDGGGDSGSGPVRGAGAGSGAPAPAWAVPLMGREELAAALARAAGGGARRDRPVRPPP